jgi:hypothetical protein
MEKSPLQVQQLINLLLAMNPRAEVLLHDANGELRLLTDEDVQEIYAPEQPAKTVAHIGVPASTAVRGSEEKL